MLISFIILVDKSAELVGHTCCPGGFVVSFDKMSILEGEVSNIQINVGVSTVEGLDVM